MDLDMILGSGVGYIGWISDILWIVLFLLEAWWLYMINKKLWEKYAWLSWVPIVNMYSTVKAGWKNGIWVLYVILWFIALIIPWLVLWIIVLHWISKRTGRTWWSTLWLIFVPFIMLPVIGYKLKDEKDNESEPEKIWDNVEL
jgi:hypothetical protein